MAYKIEMPRVGESVVEAVIDKWLVKAGQRVEEYDPLVEVVTDKVAMEIPAPASGTITKIVVAAGDTVPIGAVIAEMDADDAPERSDPGPVESQGGTSYTPNFDRTGTIVQEANVGPTGGVFRDTSLQAPPQSPHTALSPVVMRLAAEHGIDPASVKGTGRGGRITKSDILAAVSRRNRAAHSIGDDGDELLIQNPLKKLTAEHMARSWREIPHAWSAIEIDVSGMVACRQANRESALGRHGVNLTYLPFTLWAAARSLAENKLLNSTWQGNRAYVRARINLGIAVATHDGLVVPVLHDADAGSVSQMAVRVSKIVSKAREGKLDLEDVRGGTFTLNNTGALGSVLGGAIINHPQTAILTTETVVKRPVAVSLEGRDKIEVREMMNACLSFDHRLIDGAEAAAFLQDFKGRLESIDADSTIE